MTAAAARKLGMDVILVLGGEDFERFDGNLLMDIVLGADIRYLVGANVKDMEEEMARIADDLRSQGRKPYVVTIGGSSPIGSLGYVEAMRELSTQLEGDDRKAQIFFAVGSGGTIAGCVLGAKLFLPEAKIIGISVSRSSKALRQGSLDIASSAASLIEADITLSEDDFKIYDEFYGIKYGIPTEAGNEAVLLAAQTEGLILDPVYTGKAMSGLIALAKSGSIDTERSTVFIHTGGAPGLMAFESEFRKYARFSKTKIKDPKQKIY
jgi:D-cysteine desulfhydrase